MKFNSLSVKNIRTLKSLELTFDPTITIIQGGNTAGKTSMLYSCLYALFGLQGIPITKEELFRTGTSSSKVTLSFDSDGETYIVTRSKSSSLITNLAGKELANGHSNVSDYIKTLLNCTDTKDYLIDATSVVDATSVSSIDENISQVQNYSRALDTLGKVKAYAKITKEDADDIPLLGVLDQEVMDKLKAETEEYDRRDKLVTDLSYEIDKVKELLTFNSICIDTKKELAKHPRLEYLHNLIADLRCQYDYARDTLSDYNKYQTKLARKELIMSQLSEMTDPEDEDKLNEKLGKLKEELSICKQVQELEKLTYIDTSNLNRELEKLKEHINYALGNNKLINSWQEYLRLKDKTLGMNLTDVTEQLNLHNELDEQHKKLKDAICPSCGTVLSPESLDEAQAFIDDNPYPDIPPRQLQQVSSYLLSLEDLDAVEPEDKNLVDIVELRRYYNKLEAKVDRIEHDNGSIKKLREELNDYDLSTIRNSDQINLDIARLQDRLDKVTGKQGIKFRKLTSELKDLDNDNFKPVELSGEEEKVVEDYPKEYSRLSLLVDKVTKLEVAYKEAETKLLELTDGTFTYDYDYNAELGRLQRNFTVNQDFLVTNNRPNYEYILEQQLNAIESNAYRAKMKDKALKLKQLSRNMGSAVEKAKAKVWSTMLSQANTFVRTISEGTMYDIVKEDNQFYFTEKQLNDEVPYRRSLRGGASGYQRTLIGLALRLAYRSLAGDNFPFLLDEIGGRLEAKNRISFITQLTRLPNHQIIYVSHETTDVSLGEVKLIGEKHD